MVDDALEGRSRRFEGLHAGNGRPSITAARVIRALPSRIFHSIRSGRRLMELPDQNLLSCWFNDSAIRLPFTAD